MTGQQSATRLVSIDVLRAVIMLLMIFVNDLWSLRQIPQWLEHVPADADGMGLADMVFPAFLVIVGMSIPFAVNNRRKKGDGDRKILIHIAGRSTALIIMGLFLVNGEYINEEASGIHRLLWNTLSCLSFILVWNDYPLTTNPRLVRILKFTGVAIMITLAVLYRAGNNSDVHGFAVYWWGILGLIGWAYLVCGILYVLVGGRLIPAIFVWLGFNFLSVLSHSAPDMVRFMKIVLDPLGGGAMPALVMGGTVISMVYLFYKEKEKEFAWFAAMAAALAIFLLAGFLFRSYWGISKIRATPSWVWICSAITIVIFMGIYWMVEKKRRLNLFQFIRPGGTNTLLCYLIPYFAYAFMSLLPVSLPDFLLTGVPGLLKSFAFALLVIGIAGLLEKWRLRIKL
jgi:heparan-alpha-glucosaminide N-acetyltransferase